jgi:hypothetical protein
MRVLLIGLAATTISLLLASANAADHHHRWHVARIGPQSCFLMPDVAVAINALGPYCSSPRGSYRAAQAAPAVIGLVPYYGFYRPWGWSDIGWWGWW